MAFSGKHQPKPLPFDPTKLTGTSEKLIRSHHENNYTGAVKALNVIEQRLVTLAKENDLPPYIYGDLKRQELIRTGLWFFTKSISPNSAATAKRMETPKS